MRLLVYGLLLFLALTGTARIALFVINRGVFRQRSGERDRMRWLMIFVPPLLLLLSLLFIPLYLSLERGGMTDGARAGLVWLILSTCTGIYWIVDRGWRNFHPSIIDGVRSGPTLTIERRKRHIPQWLRRLGAHNDLYDLEVTFHDVLLDHLPPALDGYRIAFVTDPHVASFMRRAFYRECVRQIGEAKADLVLLGGDFVTWRHHIPLMAELLITGLAPPDGTWAVLGNHDYWADSDGVVAALTARGVRFVINRNVQIHRDGATFDIVGIDEVYRGRPDVEAAFSGLEENGVRIGLSHHPDIIRRLDNRRLDLLLCGHTHGGQIRLPWLGAVVVPSKHEGQYAAGFFRQRRILMYVSRGLGAVPPIRILCPPELPIFTLRKGERPGERTDNDPAQRSLDPR